MTHDLKSAFCFDETGREQVARVDWFHGRPTLLPRDTLPVFMVSVGPMSVRVSVLEQWADTEAGLRAVATVVENNYYRGVDLKRVGYAVRDWMLSGGIARPGTIHTFDGWVENSMRVWAVEKMPELIPSADVNPLRRTGLLSLL